jgi:protocatechuate 3,4-dioxygenase beta subunit
VQFKTIYPGWYVGRTVHIHAKVHLDKRTVLTTQLFFDDEISQRVFEQKPYSARSGRDTFNNDDTIFDKRLLVTLERDGSGTSQ